METGCAVASTQAKPSQQDSSQVAPPSPADPILAPPVLEAGHPALPGGGFTVDLELGESHRKVQFTVVTHD